MYPHLTRSCEFSPHSSTQSPSNTSTAPQRGLGLREMSPDTCRLTGGVSRYVMIFLRPNEPLTSFMSIITPIPPASLPVGLHTAPRLSTHPAFPVHRWLPRHHSNGLQPHPRPTLKHFHQPNTDGWATRSYKICIATKSRIHEDRREDSYLSRRTNIPLEWTLTNSRCSDTDINRSKMHEFIECPSVAKQKYGSVRASN